MNNEMKTPLKNPYITVNYYIYQNFEMMRSLTEVPDPTVRGAAPSGALQSANGSAPNTTNPKGSHNLFSISKCSQYFLFIV